MLLEREGIRFLPSFPINPSYPAPAKILSLHTTNPLGIYHLFRCDSPIDSLRRFSGIRLGGGDSYLVSAMGKPRARSTLSSGKALASTRRWTEGQLVASVVDTASLPSDEGEREDPTFRPEQDVMEEEPGAGAKGPGESGDSGSGNSLNPADPRDPAEHTGMETDEAPKGVKSSDSSSDGTGSGSDASMGAPGPVTVDDCMKIIDAMSARLNALEADGTARMMGKMSVSEGRPKWEFHKPASFSGNKDQNIREWLASMKLYLDGTNCWDPDTRLALYVSYLEGRAKTYWLARFSEYSLGARAFEVGLPTPVKKVTEDLFVKTMITGFGTIDPIQSAWDKLTKLKQGTLSVEEYARQFDALCAELNTEGPSQNDKIVRFKAGLHPKMQNRVVAQADGTRWTDYRALVAYSSAIWSHLAPTLESGGPGFAATSAKGGNKRKEHGAGGEGGSSGGGAKPGKGGRFKPKHAGGISKRSDKATRKIAAKRVLSDAKRQELIKAGKCLNCEELGHFSRDCPNPAKPSSGN